jgi:hypothetical protein
MHSYCFDESCIVVLLVNLAPVTIPHLLHQLLGEPRLQKLLDGGSSLGRYFLVGKATRAATAKSIHVSEKTT